LVRGVKKEKKLVSTKRFTAITLRRRVVAFAVALAAV